MSMDHFHEEVVVKKNTSTNRLVYFFSWIVMILSAIWALINIQVVLRAFNVFSLLNALAFSAIAVCIFLLHDRLLTEFEYTFTNGSLDFAQVFNNKKRKSLGSLNVKTVDAFGKVSSGSFQRFLNMPDIKKMNWFLNRDAELYYFVFSKDSVKKMIIFEPSEELVSLIKLYIPYGVYQVN